MTRVILLLLLFTSVLQFVKPFGIIFDVMLLRCERTGKSLMNEINNYTDEQIKSSSLVSLYFYSGKGEAEKISQMEDTSSVKGFDRTKPTRVVIHGFLNSYTSKNNRRIKKAYLDNYDVNLFIVNYSGVSKDFCYNIARFRIGLVGSTIAAFLDSILGEDVWQWKHLNIIGFSLGGHTAGVVGRSVKKGKVGAIFALDPAAPLFEENSDTRLRADDAEYVECIHTSSFGVREPIGKVDFYPNFGVKQPGCNIVTKDFCSHSRAWKLFAESLLRYFTGNKCESVDEIRNKTPCDGATLTMGGNDYETKMNMSGIYYLKTNKESPYSLG